MNPIQQKLLDLSRVYNLNDFRKADLVKMVGCKYPSQINHHLEQLKKRGDLVAKDGRLVPALKSEAGLIRLSVMGEADCGAATKFADNRLMSSLLLSPSTLSVKDTDNLYALVARGDSMNKARIKGKTIEDGDYVIVEKSDSYQPEDNHIVVSLIGGLANIKRIKFDRENNRMLLLSESDRPQDFAPIIISESDDYNITGHVVDVVKGLAHE